MVISLRKGADCLVFGRCGRMRGKQAEGTRDRCSGKKVTPGGRQRTFGHDRSPWCKSEASPTTISLDSASARAGAGPAGRGASLLPTHDAALDEHHDQPAFRFVVAQAISSGRRKGLTLIEGLPVSRLHVVHHVANAPLLGKSGAADADGDEDGNDQGVHACLLCRWLQVYDAVRS